MDKALQRRGLMFVLSSPSGAGKTTITRALLNSNPHLEISISATTRPRRPGEVDGQDYYFVDIPQFNAMVDNNEMLEHAKVFSNYYGTPKLPVEEALNRGNDIIFDIDWQGTQRLREIAREDLVTVFILPPNAKELERRLRARAQDSEESIRHRMEKAADEMTHYSEYDYVLINNNIDS
jgi:guanylate kinase